MRLITLKSLDLLSELITVRVHALTLFFHSLSILCLKLLNHLRVGLLSVCLVVEVHLLLELERLLEFLLQLFKVRLTLVSLGFQELEAAFPQGSLLV